MTQYRFYLLIFLVALFSCDEESEDSEPDRQNVTIQFENKSGVDGCYLYGGEYYSVVFIVSYRDIQADINLGPNGTGFLIVNVEDGEKINIRVQGQEDDATVADADVSVRTDSRPESLKDVPRKVEFCEVFSLQFYNF